MVEDSLGGISVVPNVFFLLLLEILCVEDLLDGGDSTFVDGLLEVVLHPAEAFLLSLSIGGGAYATIAYI